MANRRCRLFHVDAFTRERFCGNPAIVVLDADELSEEQMQTIATEVNGETAFVLEAEAGDHDMQVKFFTPRHPVPFVGHATIAAQYVRAKKDGKPRGSCGNAPPQASSRSRSRKSTATCASRITQNPPSLGPIIPDHHRRQVLNALGISSPSLHVDCPLQILTKGGSRLLIGLQLAGPAGLAQAGLRRTGAPHVARRRGRLLRVRAHRDRRRGRHRVTHVRAGARHP